MEKISLKRKGIVADYIPWLLIALAVLVLIMLSIFFLKGKSFDLINKIKGLFMGGK